MERVLEGGRFKRFTSMSLEEAYPNSRPSGPPSFAVPGARRRPAERWPASGALHLAALALAISWATGAAAQELRFTSQNDFLTNNPTNDDHYTSSLELQLRRGPYTISFRENAFTDRDADRRFDETFVTVERTFRALEPWQLTAEAGIVHIGRGVFGQDLQNAIHRLLGNHEVDLEYIDTRVRPSFALAAERLFWPTRTFAVGPRLEAFAVPDLRSHAVLAVQGTWQPGPAVDLHVVAGARLSDASLDVLEPHTEGFAHVVRAGLLLWNRVVLAWTYNDYGDRREHVTIGYRFSFGDRERSPR